MIRRAVLSLAAAVPLLAGCGLAGGERAAEYGPIGSKVTTSTTVPVSSPALPTTAVVTVPPESLASPEPAAQATPITAGLPFCFPAERFVFETTQMLLQQDVAQSLERASAALSALDELIGSAPPDVAGPASTIRSELATIVADPAARGSVEAFESTALAMVQRQASTLDSFFSTTADRCGVRLTEPNRPSLDGANNIAGA